MDSKYLLSDNTDILANALNKAIEEDRNSPAKERAKEGKRYYNYEHDILENRIFYIDDNDVIREDKNASNVKIPHAFFTELVDQKVQYLLSNPVELEIEDETLKGYMKEYYDEELQLFLQEIVEGFSQKGFEYAYARTNTEDRLCFQVSDSIKTFTVYDDMNTAQRIVRYYNKDIYRDGKNVSVTYAEIWDNEKVYYFVTDKNNRFNFDDTRKLNPRPHVLAKAEDGTILKRSYDKIPFFKVANNRNGRTDLEPIKALIDDYDLMACYLSNNLQDFSEAIYVVKGFRGDDLSKLRQNIKAKKTVGVKEGGDLDIKTVSIPTEARKTKLDIDKTAIYKFGMGFDSSQIADNQGSVTNVAIQSGYSLLNMKCNKAEIRLRTLISWMNEMIIDDINRRYGTSYKITDIKDVIMDRETMTDQKENAEIEKIKEETRLLIIQSILAVAPRLDDESVLKLICEQFDLDWEEIKLLIEEEGYTKGLQEDTDPVEGEEDDIDE